MNNNSFIDNLNNLINVAIGYGTAREIDKENELINRISILLNKLGLQEDYGIIDISKNNVIPSFLYDDIYTDCIIVTKEIADKIQKETEKLIIKTDYNGNQELWKRII